MDPVAAVDRAIALGLLEVSPDQTVRVLRILPLSLPEDAADLYAMSTQALYDCWWQATSTEAQDLEVHRLALAARNYAQQRQVQQAIELFQQSLEITKKINDVYTKANTLWWLGHLANQQGDVAQALPYLQEALEIKQQLNSPDARKLAELIEQIRQQPRSDA
jgi:tetratricopeptide (TPR) repeat protein